MFNIGKILKRAWYILWNYRILWIFSLLLVIAGGGTGARFSGGGSSGYQGGSGGYRGVNPEASPFVADANAWIQQNIVPLILHPERTIATFVWIGVGLILFFLVVGAFFAVIRYVSETAILRMVNDYEQTGARIGFKQGWRLGWSRRAFRLWLIDLILALPVLIFMLLTMGAGLGVYFAWRNGAPEPGVAVIILLSILAALILGTFVLGMVFLGLLRQFFVRSAALDDSGVGTAFAQGWQIFTRGWKNAALMWLTMLGLGFMYMLGSFFLVFLLIPVFLFTAIAGLLVAAVPALIALGLASLFLVGPWNWIVAALVGLPFFLMVLGSPMLLFDGWRQIFSTSVWTLTYRELKAPLEPAPAPAVS